MTYRAPKAFIDARPHLEAFRQLDVATALAEVEKRGHGNAIHHVLIERGAKESKLTLQKLVTQKGAENIGWETSATEGLRSFALRSGTYHRVASRPAEREIMVGDFTGMTGGIYVEIDAIDAVLPSNAKLAGVMFAVLRAEEAVGPKKRDQLQITLWPRQTDASWTRTHPMGNHYGADLEPSDKSLAEAIRDSCVEGIDELRSSGLFDQGFRSLATTSWNADLQRIVEIHAAAALDIMAGPLPEPVWQDGIPGYMLLKLDGPKGENAKATLLRRGFVMEHLHD